MELKFIWERIKEKKITYSVLVIIIALLWLPIGLSDIITLPILISIVGLRVYLTVALILLGIMAFYWANGNLAKFKSLFKQPRMEEVTRICKKIHKSKASINNCINKNVKKKKRI